MIARIIVWLDSGEYVDFKVCDLSEQRIRTPLIRKGSMNCNVIRHDYSRSERVMTMW